MKIAFVTAEHALFVKVGGLADVAASLPPQFAAAGHAVRVYVPYYAQVASNLHLAWDTKHFVTVRAAGRVFHVGLFHHVTSAGVDVYLMRYDELFGRGGVYGEGNRGYEDNLLRFAVFQQAVVEHFAVDEWFPDILHFHDWHTALLPAYCAARGELDRRYGAIKQVFTIHNLGYQGVFDPSQYWVLNLPGHFYHQDWVEHFGAINCMKCALMQAHYLTTVSPTYAKEIQTPALGFGFDGILRARQHELKGILNGIDTEVWDPATDVYLPAHYTAVNATGKARCKQVLLKAMGLHTRPGLPLCGVVARLTEQKGIDLIIAIMDEIVRAGARVVMLGSGEQWMEEALRGCAARHPGNVAVRIGFDERLAHLIEAGADIFLMPSRFEPCGLNQMYSMRYGTLPVVHRTGGLADTVVDANDETLRLGTATGFVIDEPTTRALLEKIQFALALYEDRATWRRMRRAAMQTDFSWEKSARGYLQVFEQLVQR
ncbi:MAG: glycogen synthase GlgA [bacterium]|nr:glycogen synthase GlgA [bacterium]